MNKLFACVAVGGLVSAPSMASVRTAAYSQSSDIQVAQASMFAGLTYRIGVDRKTGTAKGRASLKIAGMTATPATGALKFSEGIAFTGGKTGKPALHLAGQDLGQLNTKAQLNGTNTALVVGGVILLAVAVALVASDIHHDNKCSEEEDC